MSNVVTLDASQHNVKSVTIFSSKKAEILREFDVELQKGQNEVKITSLPTFIDTESARVTGLDDAMLFDVVCTISNDEPLGMDKRSDALKELERKRVLLTSKKHALGQQADMITRVGFTLNAENNTLGVVSSFLDDYVNRSSKILEEASEVDRQIGEVEQEIAEERHKEALKRKRVPTHGSVTAIIMAQRAGKYDLKLAYMVNGASWKPSYDLRASTDGGKPPKTVTLHYRAAIVQNTGEDWDTATISLSTADPTSVTAVPYLRPLRIMPNSIPKPTLGPFQSNNRNIFQPSQGLASKGATLFGQMQQQQQVPQQQQVQQWQQQQRGFGGGGGLFGSSAPRGREREAGTGGLFGGGGAGTSSSNPSSFGSNAATAGVGTRAFGSSVNPPPPPPLPYHPAASAFGQAASAPVPAPTPPGAAEFAEPSLEEEQFEVVENAAETLGDSDNKIWDGKTTTVSESAVSSSFRIDGTCTIPSDNREHKVIIAVIPFEALVYYFAVPRMKPVAFLQCSVTNTSEYRLLPGPVNVYLDESPVSKTTILDVNPEEKFNCTLGPDHLLRIKFVRLPRVVTTVGSAFAAQTTCTTCKTTLRVQNNHTFAIKGLVLYDAIPVPGSGEHGQESTENIKVVLKEPAGLSEATGSDYVDAKNMVTSKNSSAKVRWQLFSNGGKDGKYEWNVDVGAGEEVSLSTEYDVRAPSDYKWMLQD